MRSLCSSPRWGWLRKPGTLPVWCSGGGASPPTWPATDDPVRVKPIYVVDKRNSRQLTDGNHVYRRSVTTRARCPHCTHNDLLYLGRCTRAVNDRTVCGCSCDTVSVRPHSGYVHAGAVLSAIKAGHTWGTAIAAATGESETVVYSALAWLRGRGLVVAETEPVQVAARERRPRRRVYRPAGHA
jgi:hypothetical protein